MAIEQPRQPFPPKPLAPAVDKRIIAVQLAPDLRPAMACFQQQYQPRAPSIVGSAAPARRPPAQFHAFRFRQFNRALHEHDLTTFYALQPTSRSRLWVYLTGAYGNSAGSRPANRRGQDERCGAELRRQTAVREIFTNP